MGNIFGTISDRACDLVVKDLKGWFTNNILNDSSYAADFANLFDEQLIGINRLFPNSFNKVPYIAIDVAGQKEKNLSLGRQVRSTTQTSIFSLVGTTHDITNASAVFYDNVNEQHYSVDFPVSLFPTPTAITPYEMQDVMKSQLPSDWVCIATSGDLTVSKTSLNTKTNTKPTVTATNLNFVTTHGAYAQDKYITMEATLNFGLGAESERTRKQLGDLIHLYIQKIRENNGYIYSATHPDITIFLASPFGTSGEAEINFSQAEGINWLFAVNVNGTIMIDAINQTSTEPMDAPTLVVGNGQPY